jgi:phospholipase/lecithinase/hemolysin
MHECYDAAMRRTLAIFVLMLAWVGAWAGEPIKRLYVFGDSYSDIGRGYVDTNGATAVAFFAKRLGLEMVPGNAKDAFAKSLNFAISGARSGESYTKPGPDGHVQLGMKDEVAEFATLVQTGKVKFDSASSVFFLAGGLNDSSLSTDQTVTNLETEMQTLYALGARRFLLAVLPETIPAFSAVGIRLNPALRKIPESMRPKLADAQIELSGWGRFFDDALAHASLYGITNTTDPCAPRPPPGEHEKPCASPDTYFYYHPYHPSKATAKVVGDMMYDEMTGVPVGSGASAAP